MNERQKLEAKLAVAKYAESKGMTVVRDYGNWIAVACSSCTQILCNTL